MIPHFDKSLGSRRFVLYASLARGTELGTDGTDFSLQSLAQRQHELRSMQNF